MKYLENGTVRCCIISEKRENYHHFVRSSGNRLFTFFSGIRAKPRRWRRTPQNVPLQNNRVYSVSSFI